MSIDIDRFEESSEEELERTSNPERVLLFLYENRDRAWKAKEIAKRSDVDENSIHPVLNRLEDRGLVRHKGSYWAITDDHDRLSDAHQYHQVTQRLDEQFGEEDREEWVEAAEHGGTGESADSVEE